MIPTAYKPHQTAHFCGCNGSRVSSRCSLAQIRQFCLLMYPLSQKCASSLNKIRRESVIENWTFRMDHVRRSRGQHLNEIIFKKEMSKIVLSGHNKDFTIQFHFMCLI